MNWNKEVQVFNEDCMTKMSRYPDNYFDLAIVDPPYGIGADGTQGFATKKTKGFTFNKKEYKKKDWDKSIPNKDYFLELNRVSKNQIIWGANYLIKELNHLNNFIYWHKKGKSKDDKFNEGEIAFTSLGRSRMIDIWWNGFGTINSKQNRIHPTEKPISLYIWIHKNYSKEGFKIIDTHFGSGSHGIALDSINKIEKMGLSLVASELDKEYYNESKKRFLKETSWQSIF